MSKHFRVSCLLDHVMHSSHEGGVQDGGNSPSEPEQDNRRHTSIANDCLDSSCLIITVALSGKYPKETPLQ